MWVTDEVSSKAKVRTAELWYIVSGKADRGNVNHVLSGNEAYHRILISHAYLSKIMPLRWKQSNSSNLVGKWHIRRIFIGVKRIYLTSSKSDCTPWKLFADCKSATAPYRVTVCNVAVLDRLMPKLSREHQGCCVLAMANQHFLASFNFIMKAWTATNSQIETKPVSEPRLPLPLSTRPIIICHWSFPFTRESIGMKTNGEGGDVDESSVRPYPAPHLPLSASPTHPRSRHQVHSTMMLCLLKEGVWFQPQLNVGLHMARPRPKDEQYNPWQSTEKYIQMPVLWVVGRRSPSYEPGSSISSSDGNERLAGRSNCWINYSSAQWGSGLIYCCAKLKKTPIHSLR